MEIRDGYWNLYAIPKGKTVAWAVDLFERKYGHKPKWYCVHKDHPLVSIRSKAFRKSSRGPLPMKGQVYLR